MKITNTVALAAFAVSSVNAFAPPIRPNQMAFSAVPIRMAEETATDDMVGESAMPVADPYGRIGVSEEEMGIGIDATEFLQWIGTKEELMAKFQRDNKGMDEEQAASEVSKFLMDAEMVNAYIKFEKNKVENPPDLRAEAEQNLKDPKTIATYAAWLIGGGSFGYIRNVIIEPKYASGEWKEFHIELPFQEKAAEMADAAKDVSSIVGDSISSDALHSTIDSVSNTLS